MGSVGRFLFEAKEAVQELRTQHSHSKYCAGAYCGDIPRGNPLRRQQRSGASPGTGKHNKCRQRGFRDRTVVSALRSAHLPAAAAGGEAGSAVLPAPTPRLPQSGSAARR